MAADPNNLPPPFMVDDAKIIFKNFSGEKNQYNNAGDRNFCVVLDEDTARAMERDGWNIKRRKPMDDDDEALGDPFIKVVVKYKFKPPNITMITDSARTPIKEDMVGTLDWADIRRVDLFVVPHYWDVGGKNGINAYLKTMFVTIEEDPLEAKYAKMFAEEDALNE